MSQKDKYENWGFSPYPQGIRQSYISQMQKKIKESGREPTNEDKEKIRKDWDLINLFQRQVYAADQSEEAVKKRKAEKEEANQRKEERKAKEEAKALDKSKKEERKRSKSQGKSQKRGKSVEKESDEGDDKEAPQNRNSISKAE